MKKGFWFVVLGAMQWATLPLFSRFVYANGSDPLTAAAFRGYIASAIFLIWFLCKGKLKGVTLREIPFYLCYGIFGVGGTFVFYMIAIDLLSTSMASMLLYTAPAFVIIFSRIFFGDPITKIKLAGLLCTLGGCFLVVRGYDFSSFSGNLTGILIGLASGICYSMVTILGRIANKKHDSTTNTGLMTMLGSLMFLFIKPPWTLSMPTLPLWGGYAGLAVIGSIGAYLAYLKGLSSGLDGGLASMTATLEPVLATTLGVLVLGDPIEIWQIAGIAVVLCGIGLPLFWKGSGTDAQPACKAPESNQDAITP